MTVKQFTDSFCAHVLPDIVNEYGPNDRPAIRQTWNDFADAQRKDGNLRQSFQTSVPTAILNNPIKYIPFANFKLARI